MTHRTDFPTFQSFTLKAHSFQIEFDKASAPLSLARLREMLNMLRYERTVVLGGKRIADQADRDRLRAADVFITTLQHEIDARVDAPDVADEKQPLK
jgi:hypothetical protein